MDSTETKIRGLELTTESTVTKTDKSTIHELWCPGGIHGDTSKAHWIKVDKLTVVRGYYLSCKEHGVNLATLK